LICMGRLWQVRDWCWLQEDEGIQGFQDLLEELCRLRGAVMAAAVRAERDGTCVTSRQ